MICCYCDISKKNMCVGKIENTYFYNRTNEYTLPDDKYRTYVSYLLLKQMVAKIYNLNLDKIDIVRDKNNKPQIKDNGFCFNISHSKNIVAIVVDDNPIGIDVEQLRKTDLRVVAKYFDTMSPQIQNSIYPDEEYTKQWTIYESQLKLFGSQQLLMQNKTKVFTHSFTLSDSADTKYHLSVSSSNPFDNIEIVQINNPKI